ncbi:MAG: hypothetical protein ACQET7_07520 [Thermodesulfobacteriota bacterium]
MKKLSVFHIGVFIVSFITILVFSHVAYSDESIEAWTKKVEALNKRAESVTDMAELMEIMQELKGLMQQMPQPSIGLGGDSFSRGNTPEEEVEQRVEAINRTYRDLIMGLPRIGPDQEVLIPVPFATKLKGHIKVIGKDSDPPQNNWIPLTLQYSLQEDFVGYLIITDYYDPKRALFTDKREYTIHSISIDIHVRSLSGRQCVETHSAPFVQCAEWRSFDTYDVNEGDVYPAFYDRVVLGATDGDTVSLKIETPSVYFRSVDKKAGRGIGCYGTTIEESTSWFASAIEERSIQWKGQVGTASKVTPRCEVGSSIELHMDLCDPKDFADMDKCMQIDMLLEDARLFLLLGESYKDMAGGAESVDHLRQLVTLDIQSEFPGVDMTNDEYLDKIAGGFDTCSSGITIPPICKDCKPRPLCRWQEEALEVHEKTHFEDFVEDSNLKKLFCNPELYGDANWVDREQAKKLGELEYRAYSEQARYLVDIIEEQLSKHYECQFSMGFFVKLNQARGDLKERQKK